MIVIGNYDLGSAAEERVVVLGEEAEEGRRGFLDVTPCGRAFGRDRWDWLEGSGDRPEFNMVEVTQAPEAFRDEH